jgi:hypothetical protein
MAVQPIFAVPPHIVCDCGPLQAWYTDPPGAVAQISATAPLTLDMAHWLVGPAFDAMRASFSQPTGLLLVLDVRAMTERDKAVRTLLMDRAREHIGRFASVVIIPPLQTKPLYLIGLHAAVALISVFGAVVTVETTLPEILSRYNLRAL